MTSRDQLQETLCKRLFWHTAERDDAIVADYLFHHREISDLLLTDELLMSICGFNAHQVRNGSCDRGTKLRKTPSPQSEVPCA